MDTSYSLFINHGLKVALERKGAADAWFEKDINWDVFNGKKMILGNDTYQVNYSKLDVDVSGTKRKMHLYDRDTKEVNVIETEYVRFHIKRQCDLINMLDLVVPNPDNVSLSDILVKIEVEFGGQRFDTFSVSEDIDTQIKASAAIFNRVISYRNGRTFIPLALASLHNSDLVFPSSIYHELLILVSFKPEYLKKYNVSNIEIYGNKYIVQNRHALFNSAHQFCTVQHQYTNKEVIKNGFGSFKLNYNHPVYLIYFWGFDKDKVKNVRLTLEDQVFFEGPLDALEHKKECMGLGHVEPAILFLSQDLPGVRTKCSVNFSRIDNPILEIQTEEDCAPVYIVGINMQPLKYSCGMVGLVFSK